MKLFTHWDLHWENMSVHQKFIYFFKKHPLHLLQNCRASLHWLTPHYTFDHTPSKHQETLNAYLEARSFTTLVIFQLCCAHHELLLFVHKPEELCATHETYSQLVQKILHCISQSFWLGLLLDLTCQQSKRDQWRLTKHSVKVTQKKIRLHKHHNEELNKNSI